MGTGVTVEVDCLEEKSWKFAVDWKGSEFERPREVFQSVGFVWVAVVAAGIWMLAVGLKTLILMVEQTW